MSPERAHGARLVAELDMDEPDRPRGSSIFQRKAATNIFCLRFLLVNFLFMRFFVVVKNLENV